MVKCLGQHYTHEDYVKDLIAIRKDVYPVEQYINTSTPIKHYFVKCKHTVPAAPSHMKEGIGCGKCGGKHITHEDYIKDLRKIRIDMYPIEKYINSNTPIKHLFIECRHEIEMSPNNAKSKHLYKCSNCIFLSTSSRISNKWLLEKEQELGKKLEREYSFNPNNKRYKADGYDLETNTIYEFYGDYWHGNPEIFNSEFCQKKYKITLKREQLIKKLGYNLIIIWESEYYSSSTS